MDVDAEAALRRTLAAETAKGRSKVEAAGIALWLDDERHRQGLLSEESRREAQEVILGWLGDDTGESSSAQAVVAGQLARFLGEHIRYRSEPPELKIEAALGRWRDETGGRTREPWSVPRGFPTARREGARPAPAIRRRSQRVSTRWSQLSRHREIDPTEGGKNACSRHWRDRDRRDRRAGLDRARRRLLLERACVSFA